MSKILIVVDMQNGFISNPNYIALKDKIEKLITNSNYEKIIFTKYLNNKTKNSFYIDKLNCTQLTTNDEQEICLPMPNNSIIFEKYGYGLEQKELERLKSYGEYEIDICGLQADACVYAIALQCFDNNIYPNILFNYVECNSKLKDTMKIIFTKQFGKVDEIN